MKQDATARARRLRLQALTAAAAAAGTCAAPLAFAQAADPNPYYIGVNQSIAHTNNVFSSTNRISGTYGTTRLVGGFDQPIGRQRIFGNVAVGRSYYFDDDGPQDVAGTTVNVKYPDNTNYSAEAGWDWETIEKLSGTLRGSATQGLVLPSDATLNTTSNERNLVRTQQVAASARYGGQGILSVEGNVGYSRVNYSDADSADSDSRSGSIGLFYRAGPTLRLGAAVRFTRTESEATALSAANEEKGSNLDLLANWQPTVRTGVDGRLSYSRLRNDNVVGRDFNGVTGSIAARYAATEKIRLRASYSRDAGVNGGFYTITSAAPPTAAPAPGAPNAPAPAPAPTPSAPSAPTGIADASRTSDTFALGASYAATAKISVNASASYSNSKQVAGNGTGTTIDDKYTQYGIGVSWAIARAWDLGCDVNYWKRDLEGLPRYSATITSCTAQFTFR